MQAPFVADVKRNSLDDGPGVRTTVFFKGCPLSCVWCHNPECIRAGPELIVRPERCIGCKDCVAACPHNAVGPGGGLETDRDRCRLDGACVDACPGGAREIVGRRYSIDELVRLLLRDEALYRNSGGGVTLSGGEPTMYMQFAGTLARALHDRGVHVLVETCGQFDFEEFDERLRPWIDEVYVDLKVLDPKAHEAACGRTNETILANIERLIALEKPRTTVRMPLVPEVTATAANLEAAARWLRARGVSRIVLLPYNPLWTTKATGIGQRARYDRRTWMDAAEKKAARDAFAGLRVEGL